MQDKSYDGVIIGGGMVGAAIALGLAQRGWKLAIIERHQPQPFDPSQAPDMRVSAISAGSIKMLSTLGAWSHIQKMRSHAYRRLAVWENPGSRTEFNAHDLGTNELGHIVENRVVQLGLLDALQTYEAGVDWYWQAEVEALDTDAGRVILSNGDTLMGNWVFGADGLHANSRALADIGVTGWQYQQQVLALLVRTDYPSLDITWQQFHPSGPTAYLPLHDHYASLVWYNHSDEVKKLITLNDAQLKAAVINAFPEQLGDFDIVSKASFPIRRQHAQAYGKGKLVLLGDSAHSINPLAGQGVNLGFKDVRCLLEMFDAQVEDDELLKRYERKRMPDNTLMMMGMDAFYAAFSNDIGPIRLMRNLGLKLADKVTPLKSQIMKYAMGL